MELRTLTPPPRGASAHAFLVGQLVAQGAKTKGFAAALRRSFGRPEVCEECCGGTHHGDDFGFVAVRPDAFTVTDGEVCAYEVEVTSPLTSTKLDTYVEIWASLDEEGVRCRLFSIDAAGMMREVDLEQRYFEAVR